MFMQNQFDISLWLVSSLLLFIGVIAFIPLAKTLLGILFILASKIFHTRQISLYKFGVKLLPTFLRAALGIGLAMTFVQPAHASSQPIIVDRVVEVETSTPEVSDQTYVVKKGDSLWKIAEAHLPENTSVSEIDTAWRKLWDQNRDIIGDNPSLIYVGQRLVLP